MSKTINKHLPELADYIWDTSGDRCCLASRLVPKDQRVSPCLAVVYQKCPTAHRAEDINCVKPLVLAWTAFPGCEMTARLLTRGTGTSLENCQEQAVGALVARRILAYPLLSVVRP